MNPDDGGSKCIPVALVSQVPKHKPPPPTTLTVVVEDVSVGLVVVIVEDLL